MLKRLMSGLIVSIAIIQYAPALAQTSADLKQSEGVNPYILCPDRPLNSVCQPYHVDPISLEERPGEEIVGCVLRIEESELKGACKYVIEPEQVTVYIEEGQALASLNDEKPTRIVHAATNNIVKLFYEEDTQENRRRLLDVLVPPVRILSGIFRKPQEISLISVVFPENLTTVRPETFSAATDTTEEPIAEELIAEEPIAEELIAEELIAEELIAEEPIAEEPIAEEPIAEEPTATQPRMMPIILTLVTDQGQGGDVRSQLETLTGLPSEAPPTES